MQQTICSDCQAAVPTADAFAVEETHYCRNCLETRLKENDHGGIRHELISQCVDFTVCCECKTDFGETHLEDIAGLPFCPQCADYVRNRPFPKWLKLSVVIFSAVTVFAFAHNWRFFMAYVEALRGNRALSENRIEDGIRLLISAGERAPEVPELFFYSHFLKAQQILDDSPDAALALLGDVRPIVPPSVQEQFDQIVLHAEMSQAFDTKDYDAFLEKAQSLEQRNPTDPTALGSVASALACKYATTGEDPFREQSLMKLDQAREAAKSAGDDGFPEYENRILHRLHSRQILTREEFLEKFPEGWKEDGHG